jgi:2-polyprenyl-3-methyl-5-hydroxy-6-metoxy-1,4-benzoquinol methylase
MDVKEEEILGPHVRSHWYYVSKGRALERVLKGIKANRALDIGAGSGVFARRLIDAGICENAICVDPAYKEERIEDHQGHQLSFVRSVPADDTQELILMMDVLEHVADDVGLLRHYSRTLSPEGRVVITVPAFQFIWSGHDEFLEHYRRYTNTSIEKVVTSAGLEIIDTRYFFGLLFPVVVAQRLAKRFSVRHRGRRATSSLRLYPEWLNNALILTHDIERGVLFPWNRLAGLTIFCLARPRVIGSGKCPMPV